LPGVGSGRDHFFASVKFDQFLGGRDLEPEPTHTIDAKRECRKTPAFGGSKNPRRGAEVVGFGRTKKKSESIQRGARQFQELVPPFLLHGKSAIEHKKIFGDFADLRLFKIVSVNCSWQRGKSRRKGSN